jgi:membrane protein implicated in regulation of membrane protease activity
VTALGANLTMLEVLWLVVSLFFVLFMVYAGVVMWVNTASVRGLLEQGSEDKRARERALQDLLVTAAELSKKAQTALTISDRQTEALSQKLDKNTELTIKAAAASAEAASVANSANEKIAKTNQHLSDVLKKRKEPSHE